MEVGLFIAVAGIFCAISIAGLSSAIGIWYPANATAGVMTEEAKNFGRYLMFVALPGTQGIYGFVVGFLWIQSLGILGKPIHLSIWQGLEIFFSCLPVAIGGITAVYQGKVCESGVYMTSKKPEEAGKGMVMGIFIEFYAVLGLLTSLFLYMGLKGTLPTG